MKSTRTAPEWFTGGSQYTNEGIEQVTDKSRSIKDKSKIAMSQRNCSNSPTPRSQNDGVLSPMPQPRGYHDLHGVLAIESKPLNMPHHHSLLTNYGSVSTSSSSDDYSSFMPPRLVPTISDEEQFMASSPPQELTSLTPTQSRGNKTTTSQKPPNIHEFSSSLETLSIRSSHNSITRYEPGNEDDRNAHDIPHEKKRIKKSKWSTKKSKKFRRKIEEAKDRENRIKKLLDSENEEQDENGCRELSFALLFYIQLFCIFFIAVYYGRQPHKGLQQINSKPPSSPMVQTDVNIETKDVVNISSTYSEVSSPSVYTNPLTVTQGWQPRDYFNSTEELSPFLNQNVRNTKQDDRSDLLKMSCITGIYAASLSVMMVGMMMILRKSLIISLLLLIDFLCFGWVSVGMIVCPYSVVPVLGIIILAICTAYTIVVWDRIPFVSTNLDIALTATRCTIDILIAGFVSVLIALAWNIIWTTAIFGIHDHISYSQGKERHKIEHCLLIDTVLIIAYFWTLNVIMNVINVTVSATIGKWWFDPQQLQPCCAKTFLDSLARSVSTSFGSICLGSLFIPPIQLCRSTKTSQDDIDDILISHRSTSTILSSMSSSNLDNFLDPFNPFAFSMVGIYPSNLFKAGKKASEIFKATNWTESVLSDRLVKNILLMASIMIGLMNGLFAVLVQDYDGYNNITSRLSPSKAAFLLGLFNGIVLSSVFLNVLNSSMNTVLLCFAIGPHEFRQNHPRLSENMRSTWGGLWADDAV